MPFQRLQLRVINKIILDSDPDGFLEIFQTLDEILIFPLEHVGLMIFCNNFDQLDDISAEEYLQLKANIAKKNIYFALVGGDCLLVVEGQQSSQHELCQPEDREDRI